MILTSNRGFAEWGEVFGDPVVATALLDRLLHHAVVIPIEGASYRLRDRADLIPEHIRATAPIAPPPPPKSRRGRPRKEIRAGRMSWLVTRRTGWGKYTSAQLGNFTSALTEEA